MQRARTVGTVWHRVVKDAQTPCSVLRDIVVRVDLRQPRIRSCSLFQRPVPTETSRSVARRPASTVKSCVVVRARVVRDVSRVRSSFRHIQARFAPHNAGGRTGEARSNKTNTTGRNARSISRGVRYCSDEQLQL